MDISGVLNPAVNQTARQRPGDAVSAVPIEKTGNVDVEAKGRSPDTVTTPTQEIPTDKLPPHLGRNIDVSA